jgi:cytochrome oxidase Cu insertion factor (SCO1/SenC/PrrC family)
VREGPVEKRAGVSVKAAIGFWLMATTLSACAGRLPEGIEVGSPAPEFTLPESRGGTVGLADYAGRPVLLYFHMALG